MFREYLWARSIQKRRKALEQALSGYPLYDPPYKVEERLLSREQAMENFDYFMRVRKQRLDHFQDWLRWHFGETVSLDRQGMRALSRWAYRYAGFLLVAGRGGKPTMSYFDYDPAWTGKHAGLNVVFDIGITLGEAVLAHCPKLCWDFDPTSAILPAKAAHSKKIAGAGFWRPRLAGFENPAATVAPLGDAWTVAARMRSDTTTVEGIKSFRKLFDFERRLFRDVLLGIFELTLRHYPEGDPIGLRRGLGAAKYLEHIDAKASDPIETLAEYYLAQRR